METLFRYYADQNPKSSISPLCSSLSLNGFASFLYRIPFNIDSTERTSRANIFASTTAYANLFIYMGNRQPVFIRHHCDSLRGTVFRAGPTTSSVCINDAIFLDKTTYPICVRCFCFTLIGRIAPLGTNISANSTIKIAESFLETDGRLHYSCQAILHESWLQYMRWAFADTKDGTMYIAAENVHG